MGNTYKDSKRYLTEERVKSAKKSYSDDDWDDWDSTILYPDSTADQHSYYDLDDVEDVGVQDVAD